MDTENSYPVLHAQDVQAIAQAVVAALRFVENDQVLTGNEAAVYVKCRSYRAFTAWCSRWHVHSCGQKRYARTKLDMGLDREARNVRR